MMTTKSGKWDRKIWPIAGLARTGVLFSLFMVAIFRFCIADSRAEAVSLGPFKPKVTVYDISLDTTVNVSADVVTHLDGAQAELNIFASLAQDELSTKLNAIANKLLPLKISAPACKFEIQRISSLVVSVVNNTGDVRITAFVVPHECPLTEGDVSVWLRFTPTTTVSSLSLKTEKIEVTVPTEWNFVGVVLNKDPRKIIRDEIKKLVEARAFSMPSIEQVRAAFQGASLDTKANAIVLRIRFDAQINQPANHEYFEQVGSG